MTAKIGNLVQMMQRNFSVSMQTQAHKEFNFIIANTVQGNKHVTRNTKRLEGIQCIWEDTFIK